GRRCSAGSTPGGCKPSGCSPCTLASCFTLLFCDMGPESSRRVIPCPDFSISRDDGGARRPRRVLQNINRSGTDVYIPVETACPTFLPARIGRGQGLTPVWAAQTASRRRA